MASNDKYAIVKNVLVVLITVGLFSMFFITQDNISWIKMLTIGLLGVGGVIWLVSTCLLRRTVKFWRAVKYMMIIVSIFALSFSAFEGYMFQNAGHPPTFCNSQSDNTLKYSGILNASLIDIVQDIKNTPTLGLLRLEHPGKVSITHISLRDNSVEVGFVIGSACFGFKSSNGEPYHVSRIPIVIPASASNQIYTQPQTSEDAFQQIDSLGLQWFYDQAIETYQKQTNTTPEITELEIHIFYGMTDTYQGWTLSMTGSCKNEYMSVSRCVFYANFQIDGMLNRFNVI